jgi:hypothetical protein
MGKAAREAAAAKPKAAGAAAATTIGVAESEERGANKRKQVTDDEDDSSDDDEQDDDDATVGGVTNKQRALIQAAFVGDDVEGEFAADKAKEVEGELPKVRLMTRDRHSYYLPGDVARRQLDVNRSSASSRQRQCERRGPSVSYC